MRVHVVESARKDQGTCLKCGAEVKKGMPYKWLKGRHGPRKVVCGKCNFSDSDRTGSDKLARVYDARDTALGQLAEWSPEDGAEELKAIADEASNEFREVAEEYRQSAENIRDRFSESSTADECDERADELESYADEVEQAADPSEDFDEEDVRREVEEEFEGEKTKPEGDDAAVAEWEQERGEHVEERLKEKLEEWGEEVRSALEEALNSCPV